MTTKSAIGNRHGSAVVTLPSDTEILITRAFDAPADLVFKAYTTPEMVKQWWATRRSSGSPVTSTCASVANGATPCATKTWRSPSTASIGRSQRRTGS